MRSVCFYLVGSVGAMALALADEPQLTKEQQTFFEGKVRPILSQNCYKCHSVAEGKSKGELTLDTREGVLKGGKDGPVVVPGSPEQSMLIKAIGYTDPDLQMPPKGEKLSDQEIADLTKWVKMGAPDPRVGKVMADEGSPKGAVVSKLSGLTDKARSWWAYQPVKKPEIPEVKNTRWLATPVDAFILAKLEASNMMPNPPSSKEALIRRAYYDLTGLPPSPAEVRAFLNDPSPRAFEAVVDRLLASPHYGERWGRYWLDTARYADTRGGNNKGRDDYRYAYAWSYRDYVIDAFNKDKPYDLFIVEQLAADKLPGVDKDKTRLAALGFITLGERFNNPNDVINDRIDVVSKGFLGLTVTCARCHDHMFDPIPTKDYYALHGVFSSCIEPEEKPLLRDVKNDPQYQDYAKKRAALEVENREVYYRTLDEMLTEFRHKADAYLLAATELRGGKPSKANMEMRNEMLKKEGLDPELLQAMVKRVRQGKDPVLGPFRALAQLSTGDFPYKGKDLADKMAASREVNPLVATALKSAKLASLQDVAVVYKKLFSSVDSQGHAYITSISKATGNTTNNFPVNVAQLLEAPFKVEPGNALTTDTMRKAVQDWPRQKMQKAGFQFAKLNELELTHPGAPARAMVINDAPAAHDSPVLIRGEAQNRGPIAPRQFLEILSGPDRKPFTDGSGRLELARAIASKDNPLTARVIINRIWMHHFGEGFVPTPDNLGTQSLPPSHPELIDYLAAQFMESGWSMKKIHKLIMLSRVYQQSSDTNVAYEKLDPDNRLLWRANIRRLDFESQRDSLLAFSSKLDPAVGGKPVNITDEPYSYRRSVYGYIDRGNLPELMANFDFSDPDMPNSKRTSTVVPQQALFFMNSPMVVDVARKIVARAEVKTAPNDLAKIWAMYQIIYQRMPKAQEIEIAQKFLGLELRENMLANTKTSREMADASDNNKKHVYENGQYVRPVANKPKEKERQDARKPIQNEGERVERRPLTIWEEYAQALLLANESAYVN